MTTTLTTNTITTSLGLNGASGSYLISNGSALNFTNSSNDVMTVSNNPAGLTVKGTVVINGRDLEERLNNIEKVLGIPEVDSEMFTKYPSLKKKYDDYINELSKLRTWDALKS